MKAKKITLLITLIALIGTFTSVIPQQVFADTPGPSTVTSDFCVTPSTPAADPQNNDEHNLAVVIDGRPSPFQVQLRGMYSTPGPDTPLTSLVTFFIHDNAGTEAIPAIGATTKIGERPSTIDIGVDPKDFTGTFTTTIFTLLDEGNYVGFGCGEETENPITTDPVVGIHHSDTETFRIDRTPPTIFCEDLNFDQLETDVGQSIPLSDSRFDDFFGRGNPATSFLTVTDNLDDDVDVTNDFVGTSIPVGRDVSVTFTASDDGDIPTPDDDNTNTDTCIIFINPFERAGCEGRTLDQSGQEIEVCLEIPVRESDCGLAILGTDPSLDYGILSQGDTSLIQLLQVINRGNAPALLKVAAGDPLDLVNTPGFWINPNEAPEPPNTPPPPPPFTEQMPREATHFSLVDPLTTDPTALAAFYDSGDSFAVPAFDFEKKIIVPILDFNKITDIFWQLRINLLNILFFGDLQQTLTLELQECSFANECEILGFTCRQTGQVVE